MYRMPNIGYGSNKKTKHMMPDGFYKFTVHNLKVRREGKCVLANLIVEHVSFDFVNYCVYTCGYNVGVH